MGKASGDLTGVAAAEPIVHKLPRPSAATTASANSVLPMLLLPETCLEQCPALQKVPCPSALGPPQLPRRRPPQLFRVPVDWRLEPPIRLPEHAVCKLA